jgi:hypothetical protein
LQIVSRFILAIADLHDFVGSLNRGSFRPISLEKDAARICEEVTSTPVERRAQMSDFLIAHSTADGKSFLHRKFAIIPVQLLWF